MDYEYCDKGTIKNEEKNHSTIVLFKTVDNHDNHFGMFSSLWTIHNDNQNFSQSSPMTINVVTPVTKSFLDKSTLIKVDDQ